MLTKVFVVAVALVIAFVFARQIGGWLRAHAAKIGRYVAFSALVGLFGLLFDSLLDWLNRLVPRDWQFRSHDDHIWFVSAMTAGVVAYYVSRLREQRHNEEKSTLIKNAASFIDSVRPAVEAGWKAMDDKPTQGG